MLRCLISLLFLKSFALSAPFGEQISETGIKHSFLITGAKTALVDENCEITWEVKEKSRDGSVLADGNILIAFSNEVREYDPEKVIVFRYKLAAPNKEIGTAQRLANGNTLVTELGPKPRLLEITPDGKIAVDCPLQPETENAHMQTRMARKLPNGNYLVPHLLAFAIKEYKPDGEIVRMIKTDLPELGGREKKNWPFTAILLKDGEVMANLTNGNKTVIFDKDGKPIWIASSENVKDRFADPCGGHFLDNGNRVICSYGSSKDSMPDIFELTPDKKVVWEFKACKFRGAHQVHILTTNGKPIGGRR